MLLMCVSVHVCDDCRLTFDVTQGSERMAVGDDPPNCKVMPALQSVLMSRLENTPFYDLDISKLLPLSYRSTARYTNTPFSNLAIDLFLRKRLH